MQNKLAPATNPPTRALPYLRNAQVLLLAAICFALPMRVSYVYTLSGLLLIVWLLQGGLTARLREIMHSRLCMAFVCYYAAFMLAMLWTENVASGWRMVARQTPMLLFPLYWGSSDPSKREKYINAFILGVGVCAILAHYNFFQYNFFSTWPSGIGVDKTPGDTAPFVDRIMYTPILALGAYFGLQRTFSPSRTIVRYAIGVSTCLMISNLLFSGGRAGMVMFLVMVIAFIYDRVTARRTALLICAMLFPVALFSAYKTVDSFAHRIDVAISDLKAFETNQNTSLGLRLVYWTTSLNLYLRNPILGVGTGDFKDEYTRNKPHRWSSTPDSYNPHNQYLLTAVTTGLPGLITLALIFYSAACQRSDSRMIGLLLGFAVVCLFESYLWRSNTALTFSVLVAVLTTRTSKTGIL